jgi:putative transposase
VLAKKKQRTSRPTPRYKGTWPSSNLTFWKAEGVRCIRIPLRVPKANAFAGTWIESHKRECLNHFNCFSLDHLDYIERTSGHYYNTERPNRGTGMNNEVLDETFQPQAHGTVRFKQQRGGLIKSYYRNAA